MFRYMKLKNYKSLVDVYVDFTTKKDEPKKLVLLYGENGAGKSNLMASFLTLSEFISTKSNKTLLDKVAEDMLKEKKETIENIIELIERGTPKIIHECKTVGSTDNMVLEFGFKINNKNGVYIIETDDENIVYEKLDFVYNKNSVTFFEINNQNIKINENIITKKSYYHELKDQIEKYFGKHSFLSILNYEIRDKRKEFINENINKNLLDVIRFIRDLSIQVDVSSAIKGKMKDSVSVLRPPELLSGSITKKEEPKLDRTEDVLNIFFTSLYSDIKKVFYKKREIKNRIEYKLFEKKLVYGKTIELNFEKESTGTKKLLLMFPFLIDCSMGETAIVDEFDSGIHDILVKTLIEGVYPSITGQLIMTTHNTSLLEADIPKENIYIFLVDVNAEKKVVPITDVSEERIHPNLNLRKRYLNGVYGGTPTPMDIDFEELADDLAEED